MKKNTSIPATRRDFLQALTALSATHLFSACQSVTGRSGKSVETKAPYRLIVDAHQHLWDLNELELPWLQKADPRIAKTFLSDAYQEATEGLPVRAMYMEVAVADTQLEREAKWIEGLITSGTTQTVAAVLSGRPSHPEFAEYLDRCMDQTLLKGIRRILHDADIPRGTCLEPDFIRGIQLLGKKGLTFDVCIRPRELRDVVTLASECPETQFVLDHCGNGDPKAFQTSPKAKPNHSAAEWQRSIEAIAKKPNVACKISGVMEPMSEGWTAEDLAPVVNHCLDAFGSDRVLFSSNWPVCLLGGSLRQWVDALALITANRPETDRSKLWAENAKRIYKLTV
jgi:L-fuconolactonase